MALPSPRPRLRDVVAAVSGLVVVHDPGDNGYAVVVPADRIAQAEAAVAAWGRRRALLGYWNIVLSAFTADPKPGDIISMKFLQWWDRVYYRPHPVEGAYVIDADLITPQFYMRRTAKARDDQIAPVLANIQRYLARHNLDPAVFVRPPRRGNARTLGRRRSRQRAKARLAGTAAQPD